MTFGFVKQIWSDSSSAENKPSSMTSDAEKAIKQAILDSLYYHCQTRTYTSLDVLTKLLTDLKHVPPSNSQDQLLEIIRTYKITGKNLEATIDALYSVLYSPAPEGSGKGYEWNPHEP